MTLVWFDHGNDKEFMWFIRFTVLRVLTKIDLLGDENIIL